MNIERLVKSVVAMSCLTALEITALALGIDGAYFVPICMAIAGLGGYTIGKSGETKE